MSYSVQRSWYAATDGDNPLKSLYRLLNDSSVTKIEVSADPPVVKLIFDKAELLAMLQGQSQISDVIATSFVRRRVFWEDLRKEQADYAVKSLQEAEASLDEVSRNISLSKDASVIGLAKFIRSWASACSLVRKTLSDDLQEIAEEKATVLGYDSAGEDRYGAVNRGLIDLRRRVYPLISTLVAFLGEDDPTKPEAQRLLNMGLDMLPNAALIQGCMPDIDEAAP